MPPRDRDVWTTVVDEARTVDTTVTDQDAANARQAAADALAEARGLAESAITDPAVTGARIAEARENATLAARRADHVAATAQAAAQARRLLGLAELGARVERAAAEAEDTTAAAIGAALREIRQAIAHLRQVLAEHDAEVEPLVGEAKRLGVEPAGPMGPLPTSAHVAVGDGIRYGRLTITPLGARADQAIASAVAGDLDAARALLSPLIRHGAPPRGLRLFVAPSGAVHTFGAPLTPGVAEQVRRGELVELPADVAEQHQLGQLTAGQVKGFADPLIARRRADYRNGLNRPKARRAIEPTTFGG